MPERPPSRADRLFRALLRAFPFDFRADHGREIEQTFRAQQREAHEEGNTMAVVGLWLESIRDVFTTAPREHLVWLIRSIISRRAQPGGAVGEMVPRARHIRQRRR